MNKERRNKIQELTDKLDAICSEIEEIQFAEQDAYDNLPIGFQEGEKGEAMQQAIENLGGAAEAITEAVTALEGAQE